MDSTLKKLIQEIDESNLTLSPNEIVNEFMTFYDAIVQFKAISREMHPSVWSVPAIERQINTLQDQIRIPSPESLYNRLQQLPKTEVSNILHKCIYGDDERRQILEWLTSDDKENFVRRIGYDNKFMLILDQLLWYYESQVASSSRKHYWPTNIESLRKLCYGLMCDFNSYYSEIAPGLLDRMESDYPHNEASLDEWISWAKKYPLTMYVRWQGNQMKGVKFFTEEEKDAVSRIITTGCSIVGIPVSFSCNDGFLFQEDARKIASGKASERQKVYAAGVPILNDLEKDAFCSAVAHYCNPNDPQKIKSFFWSEGTPIREDEKIKWTRERNLFCAFIHYAYSREKAGEQDLPRGISASINHVFLDKKDKPMNVQKIKYKHLLPEVNKSIEKHKPHQTM